MPSEKAQILFVDDERPILNALRRLMRPTGHKIHVANSGPEALEVLTENSIDLVVSDMRMPQMDGAEFLTNVAKRWPDTTRMLLTGYADLTSAIDAINNGSITRYLTKPWQDSDIVMCLEQAIETQRLTREKIRLEELTAKQNDELQALNESLEEKVEQRTRAVTLAKEQLDVALDELQSSYGATVEVFSRLIQSRVGIGNRSYVARDAHAVGKSLGMDEKECRALYDASLLCDVGKVALPDSSVRTPYTQLDAKSQREYHQHPVIAEATLVSLEPLAASANIIRFHCERIDGTGFPDKAPEHAIPLGAKILAVCKSFSDLQDGSFFEARMTAVEARAYLEEQKGKRYDSIVVDRFVKWLDDRRRKSDGTAERKVTLGGLKAGMKTTRDLLDAKGLLILAKDQKITDALIERLVNIQRKVDEPLVVYVQG